MTTTILDRKLVSLIAPSFPAGEWNQQERVRKHREAEAERLYTLDQLLTACHRNGMAYMTAYDRFEEAALDDPNVTARDAIKQLSGVRLGQVEQELVLLHTAAEAAELARERVLRGLDLPPADSLGRVALDQGSPPRRVPTGTPADALLRIEPSTFESVMNQPLHSSRLATARALTGNQFQGPEGARAFQAADQSHAEAGSDFVAGLQRDQAVRAADQAARLVVAGAQLDQALQAPTQSERKKLLDKSLRKIARRLDQMEQPADAILTEAAPSPSPSSNPTRMLHQEIQQRRKQSGRPYLLELAQTPIPPAALGDSGLISPPPPEQVP